MFGLEVFPLLLGIFRHRFGGILRKQTGDMISAGGVSAPLLGILGFGILPCERFQAQRKLQHRQPMLLHVALEPVPRHPECLYAHHPRQAASAVAQPQLQGLGSYTACHEIHTYIRITFSSDVPF